MSEFMGLIYGKYEAKVSTLYLLYSNYLCAV